MQASRHLHLAFTPLFFLYIGGGCPEVDTSALLGGDPAANPSADGTSQNSGEQVLAYTTEKPSDAATQAGESCAAPGTQVTLTSPYLGGAGATYAWRLVSFTWNPVTISGDGSPTISFMAPQVSKPPLSLRFAVTVTEGTTATTHYVTSDVGCTDGTNATGASDTAPTAVAGADLTVSAGDPVLIDGSASTSPSGAPLAYSWVQVQGPPVSLGYPSDTAVTFEAPRADTDQFLTFLLTVSDGVQESTDLMNVLVVAAAASATAPPVFAIVATPLEITGFLQVRFRAITVDGQPLPQGIYNWNLGNGRTAMGTAISTRYSKAGSYVVSLCATLAGAAAPICTSATVIAGQPPVSQPSPPTSVPAPALVEISGRIRQGSVPLDGITVWDNSGSTAVSTDENGAFTLQVGPHWCGTIVPESSAYQFDPPYYSIIDITADQSHDFAATPVSLNAPASGVTPPGFAVTTADGRLTIYKNKTTFDDSILSARLQSAGSNQWKLVITAKEPIKSVGFPWDANQINMGGDASDDLIYYPYLNGQVTQVKSLREFGWGGLQYPGTCFAPFVIQADRLHSRLVAATNWPPRPVVPSYSLGRLMLVYNDPLIKGLTRSYSAILAQADGDADNGKPPWCLAVDFYKTWLASNMTREGLSPLPYTAAMQSAHGWLNIQLENGTEFDLNWVRSRWQQYKALFPWIQFWGQMSNYAGKPSLAKPALLAGEQVGCCLDLPAPHSRYQPSLGSFAASAATEGLVGFYSRPRTPYGPLDSLTLAGGMTNLAFLLDWTEQNRTQLHANAFYIDVLGAGFFGDPLTIARLLQTKFPQPTVIEYPVDIYPTAYLISGALNGGDLKGGPGRTPDKLGGTFTSTTFPNLGRYLLGDRIMFLGGSNGDWLFWGSTNAYWTERQAFLLGCKLDAIEPGETGAPGSPMNAALQLIISERDRVNWWNRRPVYKDVVGLTQVPAGVDVRNYVDVNNVNLFAVDNWQQQSGKQFFFNGKAIAIPTGRLSILNSP